MAVYKDGDKWRVIYRYTNYNGVYLATKKIGKNNPKAEQIKTDNQYRTMWNQTVDRALISGVPEGQILEVKQSEIRQKVKASIEKISGATLTRINQKVGFRLITKFGQTGIINLGKMVPLAGGVIGGGFDLVTTNIIAQNALKMFIETSVEEREQNDSDTIGDN